MAQIVELRGFNELSKKLRALGPKIEKKLLRAAMRQASNVVLRAARANAPVDDGDLRRQIKTRSLRSRPGTVRFAVIAEARAEPTQKYPGGFPYAGAVEKGHGFPGSRQRLHGKPRETEFGTQDVPPHPFMRPAWDANQQNILNKLQSELGRRIEQIAQEKA